MNCFQRIGISRSNPHSAARRQLFKAVRNLGAFFFDYRLSGRPLVRDEHGNGDFPVGERHDNVRQVRADFPAASRPARMRS